MRVFIARNTKEPFRRQLLNFFVGLFHYSPPSRYGGSPHPSYFGGRTVSPFGGRPP